MSAPRRSVARASGVPSMSVVVVCCWCVVKRGTSEERGKDGQAPVSHMHSFRGRFRVLAGSAFDFVC